MPMYIVAVFDFHDKTNVNMVTWAKNEADAIVSAAGKKDKNIKPLEKKLLCDYLTVEELQEYFSEYWNLGVSTPFEYMDMT